MSRVRGYRVTYGSVLQNVNNIIMMLKCRYMYRRVV